MNCNTHGEETSYRIRPVINDTFSKYDENLHNISNLIHQYREIAFEEHKSSKLLTDFLVQEGFIVEYGIANLSTAFVATYSNSNNSQSGRTVSFNSEFDALPEIGHACGHNLIAIAGIGAALAVKQYLQEQQTNGTVKLFGTPAEENGGGKLHLVNAGYYKDVDMNIMAHPSQNSGAFVPYRAIAKLEVEYFGKLAHAAIAPWHGKNALDALVLAYTSLSALRQQLHPLYRLHGIIVNGGRSANVIPDYSKGIFMIRTPTVNDLLNEFKPRVIQCFLAAANATGCEVKITEKGINKDVKINSILAHRYESYFSGIMNTKLLPKYEQERMSSGSTDQGHVSYAVPAIHAEFAIPTENQQGPHTKEFERATTTDEAFQQTIKASKTLASVAIDFLEDDLFAKSVVDEFKLSSTSDTTTTQS
ncbi:unnamed protein product [Didymodactylos carnosus]|uniref:Peptidase M20 domain-containing protein 2 n=1 Tax=Didymodactylos carnosus TaxID=1234261 RepID=A0A814KQ61_9BILA|nr:unnamed protein product [Didymodactylos carnosus]CAF1055142.1 unnamed protein product [Didymodactylos carnosus]CAF3649192.1 unnamed protein product [Didymodactylos carnosus]CAF3824280.1 unnamed protein product [Didymodactylos carnosus]